jgi:hypothetical protein
MVVQADINAAQSLRVEALERALQFFCEHIESPDLKPTPRNVLTVADAFATFLENSSVPLTEPLDGL